MSRVGIIAEDESDVDVVRSIISKLAKTKWGLNKFVGHGCGKLRSKCGRWSANLHDRGCSLLIVIHDSDSANPVALRETLAAAIAPCPIRIHIIVIPVREIEAWLLADHEAIRKAMKIPKPIAKIKNPEAIAHPKEHLRDLIFVRSSHKSRYVNSIHNKQIAEACSLVNLRRCASFRPLEDFLREHLR